MRWSRSVLLFQFLLFYCLASILALPAIGYTLRTETWPNGHTKEEWQITASSEGDSLRNGDYRAYYESGETMIQGRYKNDKPAGTWTWYYENGQKKKKGEYKDGCEHGKWTWWHPDGNVWQEGRFREGKASGEFRKWDYLEKYAWFSRNAEGRPHDVGGKEPTSYGLYDMHGNAAEWTGDWYESWDGSREYKTVRGGSYLDWPYIMYSSARHVGNPIYPYCDIGFRCVKDLGELTTRDSIYVSATDSSQMILIPGGSFDLSIEDQEPPFDNPKTLDGFYVDQFEVTNRKYLAFLEASYSCLSTGFKTDNAFRKNALDQPATYVSWYDADCYCQWAGKRLPSDAEWERACRGANADWPFGFGQAIGDKGISGIIDPISTEEIITPFSGEWELLEITAGQIPHESWNLLQIEASLSTAGWIELHLNNGVLRCDSITPEYARSTKYFRPDIAVKKQKTVVAGPPQTFAEVSYTEEKIIEKGGGKSQTFLKLFPDSDSGVAKMEIVRRWFEHEGQEDFFVDPPVYDANVKPVAEARFIYGKVPCQ